jgi:hypothetical protein
MCKRVYHEGITSHGSTLYPLMSTLERILDRSSSRLSDAGIHLLHNLEKGLPQRPHMVCTKSWLHCGQGECSSRGETVSFGSQSFDADAIFRKFYSEVSQMLGSGLRKKLA